MIKCKVYRSTIIFHSVLDLLLAFIQMIVGVSVV